MSFTESLQQSRLIVVAVDPSSGRVRVRGEADACTDLACSERTLVVTDEGTGKDLGALNPGDVVRLEGHTGSPQRIVVLRRAWDEMTSPEW
jgi:hypothetical protein